MNFTRFCHVTTCQRGEPLSLNSLGMAAPHNVGFKILISFNASDSLRNSYGYLNFV